MTAVEKHTQEAPETPDAGDIDAASRVLRLESEALRAMADALDGRFSEAVTLLAGAEGRVIVSGMGKSGHIARKIAATLASTGTPSHYVHPGEASHGDLGMITAADAVLAISNSGETPELSDLLVYCKRFAIPLIAITGKAGSTLCEAANVCLLLPNVAEACPMGLAPTTSTTATLALGDALAVALLERRGFTAEDFQVLHPGGKLGRGLLRVSDLMHEAGELPLVNEATVMADALLTMTNKRFGCVGVLDASGRLRGIITDGDLRRKMSDDLLARSVIEVMTASPKTIRPQALAAEALGMMNANNITSLFVVEDERPRGILHVHDCLRAGIV
ncbi:MAG: KpsF/GutQ family sugar-phosphate isomerase [Alphaproteobacteria bacterium]|jgi:arabinose-5-phosphate isomerase